MARLTRWFAAALLLILILSSSAAQGVDPQAARDAYESGDAVSAANLYEALRLQGLSSASLFYNLGAAYFESGDLGQALVNFLRAYALAPRDREVNFAIAQVRGLRVDVQPEETALIDQVAAITDGIVTTGELGALALTAWALLWGSLGVWILRPALHSRVRALLWGMIGASVILGVLLAARVYVETYRPKAVVTAFEAQAMSGPRDDYVPLFELYPAAELRLLERREGWARFTLPDGQQGWLPESDFVTVQE